ncbi:MAG TPA: carboxypeptidase-like regulatory domain-containing protein, partial [Segetibacter sp.]
MKIPLTIFLTLIIFVANAQKVADNKQSGIIIGNVLETGNSKAIADATVTIQNINDTTFVRKQLTDKNGNFEFERLPFSYFTIIISSVGFSALKIDSIHLREERFDFNLGDIKINRSTAM